MSATSIVIWATSIYIPFWVFVMLSLMSISKSVFDHYKKIENPLKLKRGFVIAFRASLVCFVFYFTLTFFLYFTNLYFNNTPYYTGSVSLLVSLYTYYKMIITYGKKGAFIETIKSISKLWK
ncbi:MAG: hypothetical protein KJ571_11585 [Bacteroidetes bacterium]|nr:hypothetical protein [Bacteroidota bacterium]